MGFQNFERNVRLRCVMLKCHLGLDVGELRAPAGMTRQSWANFLSGDPSARTLKRFSRLLGVPVSSLLADDPATIVREPIPDWDWQADYDEKQDWAGYLAQRGAA